ncbi:MAG: PspC domain-containing protein [Bacteroidia bacterium]|nr:PspC domain-containing protein [Bacteroidia bacterium]
MPKRLVKGEKMILGVCSGIATYMEIDATVVRLLFVLGLLLAGTTLFAYIIMAIIMPSA